MPACGQCGKDNPEGTAFCGYCAYPLKPSGNPGSPKPVGNPSSAPSSKPPAPPPKMLKKPEIRTPTFHSAPPPVSDDKGKGGFEWIPWSELSGGQRAGRSIAVVVAIFFVFFFARVILRGVGGNGASVPALSTSGSSAPLTEGDRKDGIESLCKVFQIYGLPKNDHDAAEAARNAAELYKLAGNQSAERSAYILTAIAAEFRAGKLGEPDCAQAGAPLPTTTEASPDDSAPDVNSDSGQQ